MSAFSLRSRFVTAALVVGLSLLALSIGVSLAYAQETPPVEEPVVTETTEVVSEPAPAPEAPAEEPAPEPAPEVTATETETAPEPAPEPEAAAVETPTPEPTPAPVLTTDKDDYHPGETASIFGSLFGSLQNIVLKIFGSDENNQNYTEEVQNLTTDENGSFKTSYTLDDLYRPFYEVFAYDTDGNELASTWFRDAAVAGYDQCANDDGNGYSSGGKSGCDWINGNINGNNSTYQEGEATVQRLWLEGFNPGSTHFVTLHYGTTKGGKHAYDFLTSWNHSEDWIEIADRCEGISGCVDANETTLAIPIDPFVESEKPGIQSGTRLYTMRGGMLDFATVPVTVSGDYSGDSDASTTVRFTVADSGALCSTKQGITSCGVVLWFGAHIADSEEWAPETGATSIPGSPYHVSLASFDGDSIGNRDNQMQAGAISAPPTIIINKVCVNGTGASFGFNIAGPTPSTPSVNCGGTTGSTTVTAGTYSVTENTLPAGWVLTNTSCTKNNQNSSNGNVALANNDVLRCTFTNTLQQGSLQIIKRVVNDNGGTATITNFGVNSTAGTLNFDGGVADGTDTIKYTSQAITVNTGSYTLRENDIGGYSEGTWSCTGANPSDTSINNGAVTVPAGGTVVCTITNNDIAPSLTLNKITNYTHGGTAPESSWTLTADGGSAGMLSGAGAAGSADVVSGSTFKAGTYSLSESAAPSGYQNGASYSCVKNGGDAVSGNSITLAVGDTATCSITNTDVAPILHLRKIVTGGTATVANFTLTANGTGSNDLSGTSPVDSGSGLLADTWALSETSVAGYSASAWSCVKNAGQAIEGASVTLGVGDEATCTITNTRDQGKIELQKDFFGTPENVTIRIGTSQNGTQVDTDVLAGDGTDGEHTVDTGTFFVSEVLTTPANYTTSLACYNDVNDDDAVDENDTAHAVNTTTGEVSVGKNDDVLCVYTNTRNQGTIVVKKVMVGGTAEFDFTGTPNGSISTNNGTIQATVDTGTYQSTEGAESGWDLTNISCNDANSSGDLNTSTATFNVEKDETVTCTFTNEKDAFIIVDKVTIPAEDENEFEFDTNYGSNFFLADETAPNNSGDLAPGSYSVAELAENGWYPVSQVCTSSKGDSEATSTISLQAGETVTCVFTNEKIQALTVAKTATTTFTRTFGWTIDKSVTPSVWNMFTGDSGTSEYTIVVNKDNGTDSAHQVGGTITISNPNTNAALDATIESVADVLNVSGAAAVDCGVTFPHVLQENSQLVCTYVKTGASVNDALNTATVSTSGLVPGDDGTAVVTFGAPTTLVNNSVDVDDTLALGDRNGITGDTTYSYDQTFSCDNHEGTHNNTATIVQTGANDSASVTVNCHELTVTKTANTSFDTTYAWTINKTGDQTTLTLSPGQEFLINYTLTVDSNDGTDSNWLVNGSITVDNPTPIDATINSVSDIISDGVGAADVNCPVSFPYTLEAGDDLICTYSKSLENADSHTNTGSATQQNYNYNKNGVGSPSGTISESGTAAVNFAGATVTEIDECITVTDTNPAGPQGVEVCVDDVPPPPTVFNYSVNVGPYTEQQCGTTVDVDNTGSFVANDSGATGSDVHNVDVNIACVCSLTQGYWKTHNDSFKGGAPTDDNWEKILPNGEETGFFTTYAANTFPFVGPNAPTVTWYQVFWTAPKGNPYYNLAHQYMAAKLNVLNGAAAPAQVASAISQAEKLFSTTAPDAVLKGKNKTTLNAQMISLAGILGAFNEGLTNPAGHCSEIPL